MPYGTRTTDNECDLHRGGGGGGGQTFLGLSDSLYLLLIVFIFSPLTGNVQAKGLHLRTLSMDNGIAFFIFCQSTVR